MKICEDRIESSCRNSTSSAVKYGDCLKSQGNIGTDKLFTGQRLDNTGLYYYGARYYDPAIGRFISADTVGQHLTNPQTLNRYSYVVNNPLKYTDPTGHDWALDGDGNFYWAIDEPTGPQGDINAYWAAQAASDTQTPTDPEDSTEASLPAVNSPVGTQEPEPAIPQPFPTETSDTDLTAKDYGKGLEVFAAAYETYDLAHMAVPFAGSLVVAALGVVVMATGIGLPAGAAIAAYGFGGLITASGIFSAGIVAYGASEWWNQEVEGAWRRVFGR